jgi:hypothetical protein
MTEELNTRARESGHPSQYRRSAGRRSKLRCFRGLFADAFVDHPPPNTTRGNSSDDYRQGRIGKSILE